MKTEFGEYITSPDGDSATLAEIIEFEAEQSLAKNSIAEYSRWQCKNIVAWIDGTIRPWRTKRTYYDKPPVISFDGQVFWLKENNL